MNALPYVLQLFLGLLAFCALLKDWNDYGKLSQKYGKVVPLSLAILTVAVTALGMYETHSDRVEQASKDATSTATIKGLSGQISDLRSDNKQATDGFRDSFSALYKQYSTLQSKTDNAKLLTEIEATKQKLIEAQNTLTRPVITPIVSFPTYIADQLPITEMTIARPLGVVPVSFIIYNPSDFTAKDGTIVVRVCDLCTFVDDKPDFTRLSGAQDTDRAHSFQRLLAHSASEVFTVDVNVPANVRTFEISVFVGCENCSPGVKKPLRTHFQ